MSNEELSELLSPYELERKPLQTLDDDHGPCSVVRNKPLKVIKISQVVN